MRRWTPIRRVFGADHLRLVGLHSHIGSQIFDVAGFELAAHRVIGLLRDVVAEFGVEKTAQMSIVDLGGGLGISYLPQDDPPPMEDLAAKIGAIVVHESEAVGLPAPTAGGRAGPRHCGPRHHHAVRGGDRQGRRRQPNRRTVATSASTAG